MAPKKILGETHSETLISKVKVGYILKDKVRIEEA
jgi:hypothetical protein